MCILTIPGISMVWCKTVVTNALRLLQSCTKLGHRHDGFLCPALTFRLNYELLFYWLIIIAIIANILPGSRHVDNIRSQCTNVWGHFWNQPWGCGFGDAMQLPYCIEHHHGWTTSHRKCPMYDLDTLDLRSLQLIYECSDIWTNATVYLRRKSTTFTWKCKN